MTTTTDHHQSFLLDHLRVNCSEGLLRLVMRENPAAGSISFEMGIVQMWGAMEECRR
jgi:hypothetical protein